MGMDIYSETHKLLYLKTLTYLIISHKKYKTIRKGMCCKIILISHR